MKKMSKGTGCEKQQKKNAKTSRKLNAVTMECKFKWRREEGNCDRNEETPWE